MAEESETADNLEAIGAQPHDFASIAMARQNKCDFTKWSSRALLTRNGRGIRQAEWRRRIARPAQFAGCPVVPKRSGIEAGNIISTLQASIFISEPFQCRDRAA